jgi:hypothetical protein
VLFLAVPQSGDAQGQQALVIQGGTLIDGNSNKGHFLVDYRY